MKRTGRIKAVYILLISFFYFNINMVNAGNSKMLIKKDPAVKKQNSSVLKTKHDTKVIVRNIIRK